MNMKSNAVRFVSVASFLLPLVSMGASFAPGSYKVDASHAKVTFKVTHLLISEVEGKFKNFEGDVVLGKKAEDIKINGTIDVGSIDTTSEKRDGHLKSPDFFNAEKFPKITFVSKKVSGSPEKLKIVGDLTIKDKTEEVTLNGKYVGEAKDDYGNERVGLKAEGKISRKAFGVGSPSKAIGDEITLEIVVEAIKNK